MKEILKNKKVLIPICIVLLVLVGLAIWLAAGGSRSGGKVSESPQEVLDIMEKAQKAYENVSSVNSVMKLDMNMEVEDTEMNIALQLGVYNLKNEDVQKTETIMTLGDFGSQAVTSYIDLKNNVVYSTSDGGSSWNKEDVSEDEAQAYVNSNDFSGFLTNIRNYKEKGAETVNGIAATRYDGVIENDYIQELMSQTGIFEQMGLQEISDDQMKKVYDEIGNIEVSMWLDPNTSLPQKMSIDLTKMMKAMLKLNKESDEDKDASDAADALKKVTMVYINKDYNSLSPIEIPKEAKNA